MSKELDKETKKGPHLPEKHLLDVFLTSAPAALALFDCDMKYIVTSQRWLEDYRLEDTEVIGRSHYEVFPEISDEWKQIHQRALAGETIKCNEDYFEREHNTPQWISWEVRPWYHDDGSIGGIMMLTEEITARKEAERQLHKNQEILIQTGKMAKVGGWEINLNTQKLIWSTEVYHIHEVEPGTEITVEEAVRFYPEPHNQRVQQIIQRALDTKEPYTFELPLITAHGKKKWVRSMGEVEVVNGTPVRLFGTFQDITEEKNRESELQKARLQAEELSHVKSQLMANVCHEIRTPLNGVIGLTQLVLDSNLPNEQRDFLNGAMSCAKTLMTLLDDIINFSKIEVGSLLIQPEPTSLRHLLDRISSLIKPKADEKQIDIQFSLAEDLPRSIRIDEVRIGQILMNLISNAIKFSHENTEVLVKLWRDPEQDHLLCSVQDSGIGISPGQLEIIFEPFCQADGTITRKFGGFGLGLAIVKRLIELMNGNMNIESRLGEGTTFTFSLPYEVCEEETTIPSSLITKPSSVVRSNARVLLVEDNEINQKLTRILLERIGCHVAVAPNGQIACDMLCAGETNDEIDIVLMDCQMPVMSGFKAAQNIRTYEQQIERHVPIIALTANAMSGDKQRCLDVGMDDYLSKPIDREKLYSLISKYSPKDSSHT